MKIPSIDQVMVVIAEMENNINITEDILISDNNQDLRKTLKENLKNNAKFLDSWIELFPDIKSLVVLKERALAICKKY